MKNSSSHIFSIFLLFNVLVASAFAFPINNIANAHSDSETCTSVGMGLAVTSYRSDGITPIAVGSIESGELIKYQAELTHLGGSRCNFEGGSLAITTPDGIIHDVATQGVPLVSEGIPFLSAMISYTVNEVDVLANYIEAESNYTDGESHLGDGHQLISANTTLSSHYIDTVLDISKTVVPTLSNTYSWNIDKSVSPDSWTLFDGDTGTSEYTIAVEKGNEFEEAHSVSGTITIYNPASFANAIIDSVEDVISELGPVTTECGVSFPYELAPDTSLICTYDTNLPDGADRINIATVTTSGDVGGNLDEELINFDSVTPTLINDSITVNDTNGDSWEFSTSDSIAYDKSFSCNNVEYLNGVGSYTHLNTALIAETQVSDIAEVDINCYQLLVEKTAIGTFDRQFTWDINKTGSDSEVLLAAGESYLVDYEVMVDVIDQTDSNWMIDGTVTITNPNPDNDANIMSLLDQVDQEPSFPLINCDGALDIILAGQTLNCTYEAISVSSNTSMNVASAELLNKNYDSKGTASDAGTSTYSGSADITFGEPNNLYDTSIDVTDSMKGVLGTVNYTDAPKTFNYQYQIGLIPLESCGESEVNNIAEFISNDSAATGSDSWMVLVNVPCFTGCTLTQGYWKNHSQSGPAPYDQGWQNLSNDEEQTMFYDSSLTWLELFRTPTRGNGYYQLSHQYMAAKLNILNGAYAPDEVIDAIANAELLFYTYTPTNIKNLKGKAKKEWTKESSILGAFNEGSIGPGHCTE